jgi:FMN phosphatase YigB (HAD superfamily)
MWTNWTASANWDSSQSLAHATVCVGDQLEVDALVATAAGLRGIWLNRKSKTVLPGVEAVVNLTDLPSLLKDLRRI